MQGTPSTSAVVERIWQRLRRQPARRMAAWLGADAERLWSKADLAAGAPWERSAARAVGRWRWVLTVSSLILFAGGTWAAWWYLPGLGHWWLGLVTGVLVHGLFILICHDCAHGSLAGRPADRWIGAAATGALLLPFTAAHYVGAHRIHHARANRVGDNNWTRLRSRLYARSRLLYVAYELLPVFNNLDRLLDVAGPVDRPAAVLAWIVALAVVLTAPFAWWWYVLTLVGLTAINGARLWVEHMGPAESPGAGLVAHTYGGCPLGFGIGNHDVHHRFPGIPAPILMVGLWMRRHEAHVATGWWRLLTERGWRHFSEPAP
jgi:fatty acid desaturase